MSVDHDWCSKAIHNSPDAVAYHRMIYDGAGNYTDYEFLYVNEAFESMTGLLRDDIIGKKVTEVLPGINESEFDWIGTYGRVSETGKTTRFEQYFKLLDRWYAVTAFSYERGYFISVFRDITAVKKSHEALQKREKRMKLKLESILSPGSDLDSLSLSEIIDTEEVQSLMDKFYQLNHIGIGIVDLNGNVLVSTGWQEICTKYHRVHPQTSKHCKESDTQLVADVAPGRFKQYKCKNNMWDIATPVIIGEKKLGNIFLGQFFFDDEKIDYGQFRFQARKYGFNEEEYIAALDKVPRWSREKVDAAMAFYKELANMISLLSYKNTELAKLLSERDFIISELRKAEEKVALYVLELESTCLKLDEEINKAYSIHQRTVPTSLPEVPGFSFASYFRPAELLGGDSFNIIRSGNKLVIYLSDVMGHGLDGAMLSVFVKEAIDSYISLKPDDIYPQKILRFINMQYQRDNYPDEYLISIFLAVIDLDTMNLTYVSAGFQNPPLIVSGRGEKKRLVCSGLFISNSVPAESVDHREYHVTLTPGTTIFFTTDGLAEQENGEEWFFQRYEDIFYRNSHLAPEAIVEAINEEFFLFNQNSMAGDDDITFLIMKVDRD